MTEKQTATPEAPVQRHEPAPRVEAPRVALGGLGAGGLWSSAHVLELQQRVGNAIVGRAIAGGRLASGPPREARGGQPNGPLRLGGLPVSVARSGPAAAKPQFQIGAGDLEYLGNSMRALLGGVDDNTRTTLLRNKTVVIGLVVDSDGDPTLVYTVNGNWTNPSLRQEADRLGITRWEATPRAAGRGAVGAPGDAEQLMIEAADANGFKVAGIAVSRTVCADCREGVRAHQRGKVQVVEVEVAEPEPGSGGGGKGGKGGKGGGGTGSGGKGGAGAAAPPAAKGGAQSEGGSSPAPKAGAGASKPAGEQDAPPAAGPAAGAPATAAPRARLRVPRLSPGAKVALKGVGGTAAGVGAGVLLGYLRGLVDQQHIDAGMLRLEPEIQAQLEAKAYEMAELMLSGSKPYGNITVDVTQEFVPEQDFPGLSLPDMPLVFLRRVAVSAAKIESSKQTTEYHWPGCREERVTSTFSSELNLPADYLDQYRRWRDDMLWIEERIERSDLADQDRQRMTEEYNRLLESAP